MNEHTPLLPCPFCGHTEPRLTEIKPHEMHYVACENCGLEAPSETGTSKDDAVAYWNTRAINERPTLLARVRELEAESNAANARAERARIEALEEAAKVADNAVECCGSPVEQWDDDGEGNPVFRGAECCNNPRPKYPNEVAAMIRALKTQEASHG